MHVKCASDFRELEQPRTWLVGINPHLNDVHQRVLFVITEEEEYLCQLLQNLFERSLDRSPKDQCGSAALSNRKGKKKRLQPHQCGVRALGCLHKQEGGDNADEEAKPWTCRANCSATGKQILRRHLTYGSSFLGEDPPKTSKEDGVPFRTDMGA